MLTNRWPSTNLTPRSRRRTNDHYPVRPLGPDKLAKILKPCSGILHARHGVPAESTSDAQVVADTRSDLVRAAVRSRFEENLRVGQERPGHADEVTCTACQRAFCSRHVSDPTFRDNRRHSGTAPDRGSWSDTDTDLDSHRRNRDSRCGR